jgi:cell division protein FtsX
MRCKHAHSRITFFGTIVVAALAFCLLGISVLLKENLGSYERNYRANLRFEIFLRDETSPRELQTLLAMIKSLDGYQSFYYRDKAEAYTQVQQSLGVQLLPDSGFNPLPNAISVSFAMQSSTARVFSGVEECLRSVRCVEETDYGKESLLAQERTLTSFGRLASALELLTFVSALMVVLWGVRKSALLRCEETRVLKLFGAGWRQIGLPLVTEGTFVGLIAAILGVSLLYLFWRLSPIPNLELAHLSAVGSVMIVLSGLLAGVASSLLIAQRQLR